MFISYAQNFEDVILWRALKHVENPFYVDIGAQDPVIDSVSRGFYEMGWRGLHVEPTATYANKLRENCPDEEVVQVAIGNGQGDIAFFEIPETGLSTGELAIAEQHRGNGAEILETTVPLMSLSELFDRVVPRTIHWLKIDVEGMEQSVIESWTPSKVRPWIVVVESTKPNSQMPSHEGWEPTLLGIGYEFSYFDGLSRYYVSLNHPELKASFGPGPNLFDGFAISGTAQTSVAAVVNKRVEDLKQERNERDRQLDELKACLNEKDLKIADLEQIVAKKDLNIVQLKESLENRERKLNDIYTSWSWKVTYPYRMVMQFLRH